MWSRPELYLAPIQRLNKATVVAHNVLVSLVCVLMYAAFLRTGRQRRTGAVGELVRLAVGRLANQDDGRRGHESDDAGDQRAAHHSAERNGAVLKHGAHTATRCMV